MKPKIFLVTVAAIVFFACNKPADADAVRLQGKWRMIMVLDLAGTNPVTKPGSIQGEVDILFVASDNVSGVFTGNTPTNDIWQNRYQIGSNNALSIPSLSMTKVMETSWGIEFVNNIVSTQKYSFTAADRLSIQTAAKILIFRKL